jgi:hypothetical protein
MAKSERHTERGRTASNAKAERGKIKPSSQTVLRPVLKKVTTSLEPDVHTQLKIISAQSGQTIEVLLRDAVSELIEKFNASDTNRP